MKHTVLLIDDDQNVLHGLARALRNQPYWLHTATSGEEAQLVLKSRKVDLIVVDEHMPGMRGGELLTWVAQHCPDVGRIVLTGQPSAETAIHAINEGRVFQFFTKPCNPVQLAVAIRKALEQKDLVEQNRQLVDDNSRRQAEQERCVSALETVDGTLARDVRSPLDALLDSWHEAACGDGHASRVSELHQIENVRDSVAEVQRLLDDLQRNWLKHTATLLAVDACSCREAIDGHAAE